MKPRQSQTTVSFVGQEGRECPHGGMGWMLGTFFQCVDQETGEQDPKGIPKAGARWEEDVCSLERSK